MVNTSVSYLRYSGHNLKVYYLGETTGVGFGRGANKVTIRRRTNLAKSSLSRGTTGRDPESRTQRNHRWQTRELEDVCRHGAPAQGLEEWEQRESEVVVVTEGGGIAMQQQQQLAAQKEGLGQPAVGEGHQQDLAEVVDEEATEALPASNPRSPKSTVFDCVGHAPSRLPDANPIPNRMEGISKQVGFLGQRRRHANFNATRLAKRSSQENFQVPSR
ncbi:uncharacterized protein K444DRAFT_658638 [Hyaloscypha bicolor E]|uniref:Uncharacterized protein n=1 Tax=Hyaloscypha bicolor E TaxID=1095630 RepID=A0A2J6TXB0_9HELO|nr:uncharacterized protein K444DRAFT_658638 [Hyaloscypha bicolor E]PMD67653.1 hypothetical protein K444DRAFT_658638 [Hyaloscypha bicolor E]